MPRMTREECQALKEEIERKWKEEYAPLVAAAERLFDEWEAKVAELQEVEDEIARLEDEQRNAAAEKQTRGKRNEEILDRLLELETEIANAERDWLEAEGKLAIAQADFAAADAALQAQLDLVEYWIEQYAIANEHLEAATPGTAEYDEWHAKFHEADGNVEAFERPLPDLEAAFEQADELLLWAGEEVDRALERLDALLNEEARLEDEYITNLDRIEELEKRDFDSEIRMLRETRLTLLKTEVEIKRIRFEQKQAEAEKKAAEIEEMQDKYNQHCLFYEEALPEEETPLEEAPIE